MHVIYLRVMAAMLPCCHGHLDIISSIHFIMIAIIKTNVLQISGTRRRMAAHIWKSCGN
jgi:hypothetical protein